MVEDLKIVVLVKEVPDTYGDRKLNLETGIADRAACDTVLDEIGERSLEVALSYADAHADTEVVVLSMAPESATATVRKGLAMGAGSAVHVVDEGLLGADLGLTAEVLAAAVKRVAFDLLITGNQSTDGSGGVLPAMLAELLDAPASVDQVRSGTMSGLAETSLAHAEGTEPTDEWPTLDMAFRRYSERAAGQGSCRVEHRPGRRTSSSQLAQATAKCCRHLEAEAGVCRSSPLS